MMAVPTISMAAAASWVNLGTATDFAVMAGSTITNTGYSVINGNIGLSPGSAVTGFPPGDEPSGSMYIANAGAIQAQNDLLTAYNDAAGQTPAEDLTGQDLGVLTLTPGVYNFSSSAQLTGRLILDGQNQSDPVFVFQIGSTLTTAVSSEVYLENGATPCRVFWQVGSSATLGVNSIFRGTIMANTSITANTGVTMLGRLLAMGGAVTLDTDTITDAICSEHEAPPAAGTPSSTATLNVIKNVAGGSEVPADFSLFVKNSSGVDVAGPAAGVVSPGTPYTLAAGTYVVGEVASAGYTPSYSVDGINSTSGNIALASGTTNTVTITNTYTPPGGGGGGAPILPLIKVIKTPDPLALTSGPGSVTYTYTVTNPGIFALSNVSVTDNKVSPVTYVSGDVNSDNLLEPTETWIYTGKTNLDATTTNTATATGSANGTIVTSLPASATVVVTPPVVTPPVVTPPVVTPPVVTPPVVTPPVVTGGKVVTRTVKGGQIPKTSTPFSAPMYELLLIGAALTLFGAVGWRNRKRYE
jgi:hypothetical protein